MSRKLDRLRGLIQAEMAARPVLYRLIFRSFGAGPDECGGFICRETGPAAEAAVAAANAACGQKHPHPAPEDLEREGEEGERGA